MAAPHARNDAEAARMIAALRDLHVGEVRRGQPEPRRVPVRHETRHVLADDRLAEDGAIQDVATLEGSLSGIGLGLMIGDQFKLGDHVTLDWWIIGAGFGSGKIKMEGTGNFSTSQQEDLRTEIASMDVPVGDLESEVTGSSVSITYKTGLPSLRGFGLAIGYIF